MIRSDIKGFSLVESLIVLAVIGTLLAVMMPNYQNWRERTRLKEATTQFASDLDKQRSETKRLNTQHQMSLASDGKSYTLTGVTKLVPEGITITGSGVPVIFNPPYGTVTLPLNSFTVSLDYKQAISMTVRVIGIVGKVILE